MTAIDPNPRVAGDAVPSAAQTSQWFESEPLWFKRAIFYEITRGVTTIVNGLGIVLADRVNRPRRVLTVLNFICAAAVMSCALAALAGVLSIGWLCGLEFILAVCGLLV